MAGLSGGQGPLGDQPVRPHANRQQQARAITGGASSSSRSSSSGCSMTPVDSGAAGSNGDIGARRAQNRDIGARRAQAALEEERSSGIERSGLGQQMAPEAEADRDSRPDFEPVGVADDEGRAPRTLRAPQCVSQEERDIHEATHTPFRASCPCCVRGRRATIRTIDETRSAIFKSPE